MVDAASGRWAFAGLLKEGQKYLQVTRKCFAPEAGRSSPCK